MDGRTGCLSEFRANTLAMVVERLSEACDFGNGRVSLQDIHDEVPIPSLTLAYAYARREQHFKKHG